MTRRDAWVPPLLTLVTCGLYYLYWQYVTTAELRDATGRDDLNPAVDLLISLLCCGVWSIYVQYRNMQVVHEVYASRGQAHEDKSTIVLLLHLFSVFNGFTTFVAIMFVQDELNKCGDLLAGASAAPLPRTF